MSDTIQNTGDNLFDMPHKSIEDNLLDTVHNLKDILSNNKVTKSHDNHTHQSAIDALKDILQLKNTCPPPRVTNEPLQSPRVTPNDLTINNKQLSNDPLDLIDDDDSTDEPPNISTKHKG